MRQWWEERLPRERLMLSALAALVLVFSFYQLAIYPLISYRAAAKVNYESAVATLGDVESARREILALQAVAVARSGMAPRTAVGAVASEIDLAIMRLQPHDNGDLDVWLEGVDSIKLYRWIGILYERHGIAVLRAAVQKNDDDASVRAQITFAGGNAS